MNGTAKVSGQFRVKMLVDGRETVSTFEFCLASEESDYVEREIDDVQRHVAGIIRATASAAREQGLKVVR